MPLPGGEEEWKKKDLEKNTHILFFFNNNETRFCLQKVAIITDTVLNDLVIKVLDKVLERK